MPDTLLRRKKERRVNMSVISVPKTIYLASRVALSNKEAGSQERLIKLKPMKIK